MPFNVHNWKLIETISDGEGSGSVPGYLEANGTFFRHKIIGADVPELWRRRWTRDAVRGTMITEVEGVGFCLFFINVASSSEGCSVGSLY